MHAEHPTPRRHLRSWFPRGSLLGWLALLSALVAGGLATPDARAMEVGSNHWVVAWGGGTADPFADGYQNVTGVDPWRPEFLDETAFYTVHRFMDWNRTNNSKEAIGLDISEAHKYRALRDYASSHTPIEPPPLPHFKAPGPSELSNPNVADGIDDPGDPTGSDDPAISEDPGDTLAGGCSLFAARAGTGASALIFLLVLAHALWQAWRSRRRPRSM